MGEIYHATTSFHPSCCEICIKSCQKHTQHQTNINTSVKFTKMLVFWLFFNGFSPVLRVTDDSRENYGTVVSVEEEETEGVVSFKSDSPRRLGHEAATQHYKKACVNTQSSHQDLLNQNQQVLWTKRNT